MSQPPPDALEIILRLCAAAEPHPWHPRGYAAEHQINQETMETLLMDLWLEGLIERGSADKTEGPGVTLTDRGREVLGDPELLARLRAGESVGTDPRRVAIRQALIAPLRPVATRLILAANLLVFAIGLALAWPGNLQREYLGGGLTLFGRAVAPPGRVLEIWHKLGAAQPQDLLSPSGWWRLLGAAFVHSGLLHLALNMFGLYMVGRQLETTWGRWRFVVIYLISAWSSVCVGMTPKGSLVLGASGAVCGMIGAELVWVVANRRFLTPSLRKRAYAGQVVNLVILALFTLVPNTGALGHFGGLFAGIAVAILLHWQRFGPAPVRGPALLATAVVPLAAFLFLRHAQHTEPHWRGEQDEAFQKLLTPKTHAVTKDVWKFFDSTVRPQVQKAASRRDAEAVANFLPEMGPQRARVSQLVLELNRAGPRFDEGIEEGRIAGRDYAQALAELLDLSEQCLRAGEKWTRKEDQRLEEQIRNTEGFRKAWLGMLEGR
jgi:membrane associated rhomboid family serine protease